MGREEGILWPAYGPKTTSSSTVRQCQRAVSGSVACRMRNSADLTVIPIVAELIPVTQVKSG